MAKDDEAGRGALIRCRHDDGLPAVDANDVEITRVERHFHARVLRLDQVADVRLGNLGPMRQAQIVDAAGQPLAHGLVLEMLVVAEIDLDLQAVEARLLEIPQVVLVEVVRRWYGSTG